MIEVQCLADATERTMAGLDAAMDAAIREDDGRGEEIPRVKHHGHRGVEHRNGARPPSWQGDLATFIQKLKQQPGKGIGVGGVQLAMALTEMGLIDEYGIVVHPRIIGHGPTLFAGLSKMMDLKLVSKVEFGSGAVAMRYEVKR